MLFVSLPADFKPDAFTLTHEIFQRDWFCDNIWCAECSPHTFVPQPGEHEITVESVTAAPGENISVQISLASNPGVSLFQAIFAFDERRLRLDGITQGDIFNDFNYSEPDRLQNPFSTLWYGLWHGEGDDFSVGVLVTLNFTVLENAPPGEALVRVGNVDAISRNYTEDGFTFEPVSFADGVGIVYVNS
jgi:hypothetical protein